MNPKEVLKQQIDYQNSIDKVLLEAVKREFIGQKKDFNALKDIFEKRDKLAREIDSFWVNIIANSDFADELLLLDGPVNYKDISWIKELKVEYRSNFKYYVSIKAGLNEYFENTLLEKEFSLLEVIDCINTPIKWKGKSFLDMPLLRFFSSEEPTQDDENLGIFYILSDLYFNASYHYMKLYEETEFIKDAPNSSPNDLY
ncbi:template-activating factor I [Nematocida sp. AWRm80]|nr:template-activating factor I [Nematocida sp. AWRm80]